MSGNEVIACGTPWCGKEGWNTNIMVPLRAVFLLERAEEDSIEEISLGQAFAITDITTVAPSVSIGNVNASSPEITLKPAGLQRNISITCAILPDASLIAMMLGHSSASCRVVSASILHDVRPGTLYRTMGTGDTSAMFL